MNTFESEKSLNFFCKSHSSFKTRFGILSLYKAHFSYAFEKILLTLEYIQILSLTIFIHPSVSDILNQTTGIPRFFEVIAYSLKLANPAYLLSFANSDAPTNSVLCIILGFTLLKYLLFFYILVQSAFNKTPNDFLRGTWRYIFKLQGRIICCFTTSFWVATIVNTSYGTFSISGLGDGVLISISVILIVLEYLLSFLLETQFCDLMPTKQYLAAKNFDMQILTLLQKFVLQLIQVFTDDNVSASLWVCILLNLTLSLIREYRFFTTLPLYSHKSLLYQGNLLAIVLALHWSHFFQQVLLDSEYKKEIDFRFLITLWIIISIMACQISRILLKRIHVILLTSSLKHSKNPEILLQKIYATKYLLKTAMAPTPDTKHADLDYLLEITQNQNILQIFNLQSNQINSIKAKVIHLQYLEHLTKIFPNNSLVKLNHAYLSYRSTKFHAKIIKIISELQKNTWSPYYMSSALLLHEMEKITITGLCYKNNMENNSETKSLNMIKYIESQVLMENLNTEISKQIELRNKIYANIIQDNSNLETIYQNAQIIHKSKLSIEKKINSLLHSVPEYYLQPLLVFAEYNLLLNFSIDGYYKYFEIYNRKSQRFIKEFEADDLSEENLYQDTNAFIIFAADKLESNYCIVSSTRSLQDICGPDRTNYQGFNITRLFPPSLRGYYGDILKEIFEKGQNEVAHQVISTYLCHKEGYLVKADIYIRIHPYISQNLYVNMLIRPHKSYKDFILLNDVGKIEGATKDILPFLNGDNSSEIWQISEELANLNNAFNIINNNIPQVRKRNSSLTPSKFKLQQQLPLTFLESASGDYHQAKQIYDSYDSGTKVIKLSPLDTNGEKSLHKKKSFSLTTFKCRISSLNFKDVTFNLITLEKVSLSAYTSKKTYHNLLLEESSFIDQDEFQERPEIENMTINRQISQVSQGVRSTTPFKDALQLNTTRTFQTRYDETEENVLSPTSARRLMPSSSRFRIEAKQKYEVTKDTPNSHDNQIAKIKGNISSSTYESSRISQLSSVFKTFHQAINTKYNQRSFSLLCLTFYGVILLTLISQIVLKTVLDDTMDNLITKSSLLNYAQLRTYHCTIIHNTARGSRLIRLNDEAQQKRNVDTVWASLKIIIQADDGIINNIDSESEEIKKMLFQKDINITGNALDPLDPKSELVTSFQNVDIITHVNMLLKGIHPVVGSTVVDNAYKFLMKNFIDDFLAKNDEIIQAFVASVNHQKNNLQQLIKLFVIVLPLLLVGIVALLSVIIWKQYDKEKRHLLAFLRLNPRMIQHILENLKSFQSKLNHQEKFETELSPDRIYKLERSAQFSISYHKRHDQKAVDSRGMQRRYSGYILKVMVYISLLITIVILNYSYTTKATNKIYLQQRQLQYANEITTIFAVSYIAEVESFVTNNTNYIMRKPPLNIWKQGINQVKDIQENIYAEFKLENGDYDPEVRHILFDPANCTLFEFSAYDNCIVLENLGQPTAMVSAISQYHTMLSSKLTDYNAVDKSSAAAMLAVAFANLNYLLSPARVTTASAQLINKIMSKKLAKSVDDLYDLGTTILIIFSLTLLVVSVLIWFQILTKVKEVNNDFKKVLAVLPPNIILSSFLLKTFLNKTSNIAQKL